MCIGEVAEEWADIQKSERLPVLLEDSWAAAVDGVVVNGHKVNATGTAYDFYSFDTMEPLWLKHNIKGYRAVRSYSRFSTPAQPEVRLFFKILYTVN